MNQIIQKTTNRLYTLWFALIGVAGGGFLYIGMRKWGIGVYYDSIFYLTAADNLLKGLGMGRLAGDGSIIPLTHYPPLYSILVAAARLVTGLDSTRSAWILTLLFFSFLIGFNGWGIYQLSRSLIAGMIGSLLVLTSPIIADLHLMAMTEPVFLIFLLAALLLIKKTIGSPKLIWVLLAALFTSAAYLSRYVGISIIAAGVVAFLIFSKTRIWMRLRLAVVYGVVSFIPNLIWSIRNLILTGSATNRLFEFHPIPLSKLSEVNNSLSGWVLSTGRIPAVLRSGLVCLILLGAVMFTLWLVYRGRTHQSDLREQDVVLFSAILGIFYLVYIAAVLGSLMFFDASTRLNDRILSPVYYALLIQVVLLVWVFVHNQPALFKIAAVGVGVLIVLLYAWDENKLLADYTRNGIGFTGRVWQKSETIQYFRQHPVTGAIYSNEAFGLYYLLNQPTFSIPQSRDPVTTMVLPDYQESIQKMDQNIQQTNGRMVIFTPFQTADVYPPLDELTHGLTIVQTNSDAEIYSAAAGQ